jgi:hypothetical protein
VDLLSLPARLACGEEQRHPDERDPRVTARCTAGQLELDVLIRLDGLSPAHPDAKLALALSAVVEEHDGTLSYWALKHPPGRPDFHHADGYALDLAEADPWSARSSACSSG